MPLVRKAAIVSFIKSIEEDCKRRVVEKLNRMNNETEMREMEGIQDSDGFHKALREVREIIKGL